MAPTDAPLGEQPGAEGNGAPPSSSDKSWIAALVDGLVPKFQADGSMQSGDSAMQTANKGKSSNAEAAQRASEPEDPLPQDLQALALPRLRQLETWDPRARADRPPMGTSTFKLVAR
ncbi:hypothetical protein PtA15_17A9 [Puccinia triticina]|uniref:Uncharacterized protein n=1 Tax=Puccinia triticina TaxID=208348 RepID=A0ABY7D4H8_9BASI|nr:uncharacterized protein PtA15_17A9 [Puccinia triticina]WAQ92528.1 hypothetical protein PtA15_17A9 [Puccinia triticina]